MVATADHADPGDLERVAEEMLLAGVRLTAPEWLSLTQHERCAMASAGATILRLLAAEIALELAGGEPTPEEVEEHAISETLDGIEARMKADG